MSAEQSPLAGFAGKARLFPLPNVVLFPHVVQPLHIFEPRYRQMTADALDGDRLIGMVLLQPGWEEDYAGRPAVHAVGCLGHIVAEQCLPDGCFNILLRGVSRFEIAHELPDSSQYRQARVSLLDDATRPGAESSRRLRRRLLRTVPTWLSTHGVVVDQLRELIRSDVPLGVLCDIISFALPLDTGFKQELLEQLSVERRVRSLLHHLQQPASRKFPPEFSVN